jgi:hypothetical protein
MLNTFSTTQEILRYSTTDVLAPQWAAMEAGVRRAADADQVRK